MTRVPVQQDSLHRQARLVAIGASFLFAGLALYVAARPTSVFGPLAPDWHLSIPRAHALRTLLGSAPTFVHVVAFSLITAAVVRLTTRRALLVCATWAVIEIAFELLQLPVLGSRLLSHAALPSVPLVRNYIAGTFDPADIIAAVLGAAFAAYVLTLHRTRLP